MEAMRARIPTELVPLGKKNRGIIQENLGQTSFKKALKTQCPSPSTPRKRSKSVSDSSDDELNLLMRPSPPASSLGFNGCQMNANIKSGPSSMNSSPSPREPKVKPKPRMVQTKSHGSSKAPFTFFSPPNTRRHNSIRTSPSDQSYEEVQSSPLEDLSQNRVDCVKKTKNIKGKAEIKDFPMDVDVIKSSFISKRSTENNLAPFPISPKKIKSVRGLKKTDSMLVSTEAHNEKRGKHPTTWNQNHASIQSSGLFSESETLRPFPMLIPVIQKPVAENPAVAIQTESIMSPDLFKESNVDPTKLCPYCDELLPEEPSPTLQRLLIKVKGKSREDPRPSNPLGLMAPLALFAEVCERHRLEANYLPLAIGRGWPRKIDFIALPDRIQGFKSVLSAFIVNPDSSTFWKELRNDMAVIGRKKLASVTGQFATFEKSQPGYYGEQGSIIIQQTLYTLFPPDTVSEEAIEPLNVEQFLSQVLLPETATLLIMEDMELSSKEKALEVLEESKKYGTAMFPERAQNNVVAEVGDRLARERALSRRKYLKEMEGAEGDVAEIGSEETKTVLRDTKKAPASSSTDTDPGCNYPQRYCITSTPRISQQTPRPKLKHHTKADQDNEAPRRAARTALKADKKPFPVSNPTTLETKSADLLSSDDSADVPWAINLRGHVLNDDKGISSTKDEAQAYRVTSPSADPTPRPKTKIKPKIIGSASETSNAEVSSKPRPKPKLVKRDHKHKFVTEDHTYKTKKDSFDWLLDDS